MFKKKDEDWNLWDEEESVDRNIPQKKNQKVRFKKKKKENVKMWDDEGPVDYLDEASGNIYSKEEKVKYSKSKIAVFIFICTIIGLGSVGVMNTDFDENNKGYIVSYDLHYERQYVQTSDELYEYCLELKKELATVMPELATNSLEKTNFVQKMKETLVAKTNKVSRYTSVPQIMASYNDSLISFSLSTQKMLDNTLNNYTATDYLLWAESAYNDFSSSLQTLQYLREQIDYVIYRNVYGGDVDE